MRLTSFCHDLAEIVLGPAPMSLFGRRFSRRELMTGYSDVVREGNAAWAPAYQISTIALDCK